MNIRRRKFLHLAAGTVALPVISRMACAQTYPSRPITLVAGAAAGGPTDTIARIITGHTGVTGSTDHYRKQRQCRWQYCSWTGRPRSARRLHAQHRRDEPFLRPGLRMQRRAERKGCQGWPSR
jgi:hypothetical protein